MKYEISAESALPLANARKAPSSRSGVIRLIKALFLGCLAYYVVFSLSGSIASWLPRLGSRCHGYHDGLIHYPGELIGWKTCGEINGQPVECSSIDVPMDNIDLENYMEMGGTKTFDIPLIRLRGKDGSKNLVLNPGGPGGSGSEFLFRRGEQLRTIVGDGFHLLSFDPRGINASKPLASCYLDAATRRRLFSPPNEHVVEDSPAEYAWAQNTVRACRENMGEYGKYINTPQTASDMNDILHSVGQEEMIYWGFSYGTLLGQTYAAMFPEKSHRVIIDGVVNQFEWYEGLFLTEDFTDTEHVLDGFFDECIKAGKDCALSSLASSKDELATKVFSLIDKLEEEPLSVYVNSTLYGTLTPGKILYEGVFPALYKPTQQWYGLAERLAALLQGNGTDALLAYGLGASAFEMEGDALWFVMLNDGASGPDYWPQERRTLLDRLVPYMNESLFAPTANRDYYLKQQWQVPRTHKYTPKLGVETAHPLLIMSQHYDPITPLVSARSAKASFAGSEIVEVMGYGHASVAAPSTCAGKHIRAFLYEGKLPDQHTQCEVDGPYFVNPKESDGLVRPFKAFDDPVDQELHLAQVALAMDPDWPMF